MDSLISIGFVIVGVAVIAMSSYAVLSIHWAWAVPFVFIGAICLIIGLIIPLQQ